MTLPKARSPGGPFSLARTKKTKMPAASSPARRKSRRVSPQAVPLQPVYLEWYDAAHVDGWTDPAKVSCELPLIQGLGFLAAESDDAIEVFLNVGRVVR